MAVTLKVYVNEDDALLFWSISAPIAECRGFAIERRLKRGADPLRTEFLLNRMGFENDPALAAPVGDAPPQKPSTEWPFQRFSWTDHDANTGDTVSYQVTPVIRKPDTTLALLSTEASGFSDPRTLGVAVASRFKPFFNRVMSFMARYLKERGLTLAAFKETIKDEDDKTIRGFLSGDLRLAMLELVKKAKDDGGAIFAALFELGDHELVAALARLGARANIVLANGSITKRKDETPAQAHQRDENSDARATLLAAGVNVHGRFTAPGPLAHNKFLVRVDAGQQPVAAWTGSTNWTPTGLCTQLNNGLLMEDGEIAAIYLAQWQRLKDAVNDFPAGLVDANDNPKPVGADVPGAVRGSVWFTRAHHQVDPTALEEEVKRARQGILFLMFMPGSAGLFSIAAARSVEPDLFVRGVVSELPNGRGDESAVDVSLIDGAEHSPLHFDIIQPREAPHPFANFAGEVTRKQFLGGIGHAIIHSKVVVIDPFSADPVVITGSHNFSASASAKNDENFIIVKGDHSLAEAYSVNIMGAYAHYGWRARIQNTDHPFRGLHDDDRWQAPKLRADRTQLKFWGV